MRLVFKEFKVADGGVINLHFVADDPGPQKASDVFIVILDSEVTGVGATDLATIQSKLARKVSAAGLVSSINPLLGRTVPGLDRSMVLVSYEVNDSGILLRFLSTDPPGGEPSDYFVQIKDSDLTGVTLTDAQTIVSIVQRRFASSPITTRLLALVGRSIDI